MLQERKFDFGLKEKRFCGDKNLSSCDLKKKAKTLFFHSKTSKRRKNEIHMIRGDDGEWRENIAKNQVILKHFKELFYRGGTRRPTN